MKERIWKTCSSKQYLLNWNEPIAFTVVTVQPKSKLNPSVFLAMLCIYEERVNELKAVAICGPEQLRLGAHFLSRPQSRWRCVESECGTLGRFVKTECGNAKVCTLGCPVGKECTKRCRMATKRPLSALGDHECMIWRSEVDNRDEKRSKQTVLIYHNYVHYILQVLFVQKNHKGTDNMRQWENSFSS
jgi:hypothetical protein